MRKSDWTNLFVIASLFFSFTLGAVLKCQHDMIVGLENRIEILELKEKQNMTYNLKTYDLDLIDSMVCENQIIVPMYEDARKLDEGSADEIFEGFKSGKVTKKEAYTELKDILMRH